MFNEDNLVFIMQKQSDCSFSSVWVTQMLNIFHEYVLQKSYFFISLYSHCKSQWFTYLFTSMLTVEFSCLKVESSSSTFIEFIFFSKKVIVDFHDCFVASVFSTTVVWLFTLIVALVYVSRSMKSFTFNDNSSSLNRNTMFMRFSEKDSDELSLIRSCDVLSVFEEIVQTLSLIVDELK